MAILIKGKIVVISGASRGIGAETAMAFSKAGASVVLTARDKKALQIVARTLEGPVLVVPADLRDQQSVSSLIRQTELKLGSPDVIVSLAGAWHNRKTRYQGPRLWETEAQRVEEVLDVGLHGAFRLIRGFLPKMVKRRSGHIVQIGCGFAGPHEAIGWVPYYVSNKAAEALVEGLAAELRECRIKVNCIAPWFVATDYVRKFYPRDIGRAISPVRVAQVILDLVAGSLSSDVSGQVIELRSDTDID